MQLQKGQTSNIKSTEILNFILPTPIFFQRTWNNHFFVNPGSGCGLSQDEEKDGRPHISRPKKEGRGEYNK